MQRVAQPIRQLRLRTSTRNQRTALPPCPRRAIHDSSASDVRNPATHHEAPSTPNPPSKPPRNTRYGRWVAGASILLLVGAASQSSWLQPSVPTERLHPTEFVPFTITSKEPVSSTSTIFTLRPPQLPPSDPYTKLWTQGLWSVQFVQPQLQIARSYTPLPPTETSVPGELRFLIRKEHGGEVSNYLHRLPIGAVIEMRGPKVEYDVPREVDEVLFVAGGTGIAPAMQAVEKFRRRNMEEAKERKSTVKILWACRKSEDCRGGVSASEQENGGGSFWWSALRVFGTATKDDAVPGTPNALVSELNKLREESGGVVSVDYFVDEERSFIGRKALKAAVESTTTRGSSGLIMVSGPEGFVAYIAGPKEWKDGREAQGPLGGLLGSMDFKGATVVKL